ncbi:hypothetical protein ACQEVB_11675 [Pseudonocardia sp. CA-107938]|uniref:hypothetical protein n=1 Tax=Pseudonocardia sp. CA-107938 TaxID=3240021 RepID=UPI003D9132BF
MTDPAPLEPPRHDPFAAPPPATPTERTNPVTAPNLEYTRDQIDDLVRHPRLNGEPVSVRDMWRLIVEAPADERPAILAAAADADVRALPSLAGAVCWKVRDLAATHHLRRQIRTAAAQVESRAAVASADAERERQASRDAELADAATRRRRDFLARNAPPNAHTGGAA